MGPVFCLRLCAPRRGPHPGSTGCAQPLSGQPQAQTAPGLGHTKADPPPASMPGACQHFTTVWLLVPTVGLGGLKLEFQNMPCVGCVNKTVECWGKNRKIGGTVSHFSPPLTAQPTPVWLPDSKDSPLPAAAPALWTSQAVPPKYQDDRGALSGLG